MNRQQTAAKNYLMRAYRVDQRIENKLEQIQQLNDLATKATVTYTDMPGSPNRNIHSFGCYAWDRKAKRRKNLGGNRCGNGAFSE